VALILTESDGHPEAFNHKSMTTGLGGIMPREAGFPERPTIQQLKNPTTNIQWMCRILASHYEGDLEKALYHYSGGSRWASYDRFQELYYARFQRKRATLLINIVRYLWNILHQG
jgi:soluble lytic murein transglycosylase-like protein